MKRLIVTPAAQLELRAAAGWYSEREAGLGEDLVLEVDRTLAPVLEAPQRNPSWRAGQPYRKAFVHRFPYVVFYLETAADVLVLAIAHRKRKPGYWLRRAR